MGNQHRTGTGTADANRLTPEELQSFHDNGFVGPFTLCSPDEMIEIRERVERDVLKKTNSIYGFEKAVGRDRHLDSRVVYDLITRSAISERLAQILGPDLLVWRSTFFFKPPGAPETVWHSANVFKEFVEQPILVPPNPDGLFQLTTWVAIDEANLENGCVQLVAGSHRTVRSVGRADKARDEKRPGEKSFGANHEGFFGYDLDDEFDIDPDRVVSMQCKPGQFFIFTQRTLHGSPPNNSSRRRLAMNFRTIRTDVSAYAHFLPQGKIEHYGETWDLTKWGCILLHGEDRVGINKIVGPPVD